MDVFIHVKGNNPIRIAWDCPFLPRVGEHLYIDDFCPGANTLEDVLIVEDVQWHVLNNGICASLFMGYDPIEADERNIKTIGLN